MWWVKGKRSFQSGQQELRRRKAEQDGDPAKDSRGGDRGQAGTQVIDKGEV